MKTFNTVSKVAGLIAVIAMSTISFGQAAGKVWARVADSKQMAHSTNADGSIRFEDPAVAAGFSGLTITGVKQALPASHVEATQRVYEVSCACDENDLLVAVARMKNVFEAPELAPVFEVMSTPNDYNMVFAQDYALNLINAQGAWDITHGDTAVEIAITDANYHLGHEELYGKYTYVGVNYNSNYTHGTAVAVTAAGATDNATGKSSIGFNSRLQLRAMDFNEVLSASYSGARIVNMSWASGCYYSQYGQDVMNEAYGNRTILIASAGNGTTCNNPAALVYPASYDHVISVSSVGPWDNHERTMGNPSTTHQHNAQVDLCAPGYDVALTIAPGSYMTGNGTSFAAPYVSGTVALMLAVNTCLSPDEVEYILKATAVNIDSLNLNYAGMLGAGRLNAAAAVEMAYKFSTFPLAVQSSFDCTSWGYAQTADLSNATSPYEITWSNGANTASTVLTSAGVQNVRVKDHKGCIGYWEGTITLPEALNTTADIVNVRCNAEASGVIELTVAGGAAPYSFEWNDGETAQNRYTLSAGTYSVQVTDANGCMSNEYFEMSEPTALTVDFTVAQPFGVHAGSFDVTVEGGTAPYSYSWNNGSTAEDLQGLGAGFYEVYIEDAKGCAVSANAVINGQVMLDNTTAQFRGTETEADNKGGETGGEVAGITAVAAQEEAVQFGPNPAVDQITVSLEAGIDQVQVYNAQGQLVKTVKAGQGSTTVTVNGLTTGNYFFALTSVNGVSSTHQFVVL